MPERYAGELGSCGRFLLQCLLVFDLQPNTYHTDPTRAAFVIGLLTHQSFSSVFLGPGGSEPLALPGVSFCGRFFPIEFQTLESGWDQTACRGYFCEA